MKLLFKIEKDEKEYQDFVEEVQEELEMEKEKDSNENTKAVELKKPEVKQTNKVKQEESKKKEKIKNEIEEKKSQNKKGKRKQHRKRSTKEDKEIPDNMDKVVEPEKDIENDNTDFPEVKFTTMFSDLVPDPNSEDEKEKDNTDT